MHKRLSERYQSSVEDLLKAMSAFSILLGLLVVIPLSLWYGWAHPTTFVTPILDTLSCLSFGWALVSAALWFRSLRKLGLDGQAGLRLYSGARPEDRDELRAWQLGWHFMCAILAVLLCIVALPIHSWLSGK